MKHVTRPIEYHVALKKSWNLRGRTKTFHVFKNAMLRKESWLKILLVGLFLALLLPVPTRVNKDEIKVASILSRVFQRFGGSRINTALTWSKSFGSVNTPTMTSKRTPVYFFSHGGPNIMEDIHHPAYAQLQKIGREITQTVKPKAVVVFSAHWQGEPKTIEVNTAESLPLIYDYYGFPPHFYELQYPNRGDPELAEKIISLLGDAGIKAEGVRRGLDHGVFASFMCAFDPKKNPLGVPIVQVSLFDSDDADQHYALGRAVESLPDEGVQIIVSGMAVHNLRDMWKAMGQPGPMPYAVSFDAALKEAVEQPVESRQKAMSDLLKRPDSRKAHPSFEHLLPIHIGAGAAGEDLGKQVWTKPEGSMSWAMYRFGEVRA